MPDFCMIHVLISTSFLKKIACSLYYFSDSPYCEPSDIGKFTQKVESCITRSYKQNHFKQLSLREYGSFIL